MKQYQELLKAIQTNGTYKPAARQNMPGTLSLFGYQFRHNLADGFPLLTTKKMFFKGVVIELLWFLRGDTNIEYLIDNGVNIWNEDAYQYYIKKCKQHDFNHVMDFDIFINNIKNFEIKAPSYPVAFKGDNYKLGDCGFQYGKVWRNWPKLNTIDQGDGKYSNKWIELDQIKNLIKGLINNPESRRHIVTAIDPANDTDLALYWCHCIMQFNCRPLTHYEKYEKLAELKIDVISRDVEEFYKKEKLPQYYLDCQLYQRSADVFLGIPFNIASYALLTEIIAKIVGMIPGEFIHTFGDVHIYDNHKEAVEEQLKRTPKKLPTVKVPRIGFDDLFDENIKITDFGDFELIDYNPDPSIKAELSTGMKK